MCYMTYGIKPDVVSMAKAMGGGMPIGAHRLHRQSCYRFRPRHPRFHLCWSPRLLRCFSGSPARAEGWQVA
ncbi:MAG: hypothetical protein ACLUNZ_08035 [Evtepia sp.]